MRGRFRERGRQLHGGGSTDCDLLRLVPISFASWELGRFAFLIASHRRRTGRRWQQRSLAPFDLSHESSWHWQPLDCCYVPWELRVWTLHPLLALVEFTVLQPADAKLIPFAHSQKTIPLNMWGGFVSGVLSPIIYFAALGFAFSCVLS